MIWKAKDRFHPVWCGSKDQSCQNRQSWREVRVMSLIRTIDCIHWRSYFVNQDVVRFCFFEGMNKILSAIICYTNINLDKYFSVAMRMLLSRNETRELNDYSLPYKWMSCVHACNNTIICQNERLIILINDQRQPKYAHHCQHTNNRVNAAKL